MRLDYLFTMLTKLLVPLSCLLLVTVAVSGCSQGSDAAESSSEPSPSASTDSASFMFGQTALSASLEDHPDSSKEEEVWTLTLNDVGTVTGAFSDRPERESFRIETEAFVAGWDDIFMADSPNAMLSTHVSDDRAGVVAVVLSEPDYKVDSGTLTYRAKPIQPTGNDAKDYSLSSTNEELPTEFGNTEVFIDGSQSIGTQVELGRS